MDNPASALAALTIEEKTRLLSGASNWSTQGSATLGLRSMVTSDGPAGVRGTSLDERSPSSCFPCPSALGATWDPGLVHEVASALGAEARGKGVDVLLAPTLNLMRTPLSGRGFECFSEDPVLTAQIAVGFVRGVQENGVAATVKHYVCNDSETQRRSYDARISEQVLRELYLVPFEACVREAGTWLVMAAYSGVNGTTMTEHDWLLREVLKEEWGFTGVVVSDWGAVRSSEATALAGLDLAMPGPDGAWGEKLAAAVEHGRVPEEVIDEKVLRLLGLARRVGATGPAARQPPALREPGSREPAGQPGGREPGGRLADQALLRRAAAASFTLLTNERQALPLDPGQVGSVAVLGPNALRPVIGGGGSAEVSPVSVSVPADALAGALQGRATVTSAPGCATWVTVPEPAPGTLTDPVGGQPGIRLEFTGPGGAVILSEARRSAAFTWWDDLPPGVGWGESGRIVLRGRFRPAVAGRYLIGASGVGRLTLSVDGAVLADAVTPVPADPVEAMTRPGEIRAAVTLAEGQQPEITLEFSPARAGEGPLAVRLGVAAEPDQEAMLAEAVRLAAAADAAVVVAGSAELTESEGFDRATLSLPGRQDELIRRVAAVNPRTVVVVNAGMPVLMPWAGQVAAVLYAWLGGQAMGDALADVLLGRVEPGGRLPVTMPARESDAPVLHALPRDGRLDYDEGLLIGYRGYDQHGTEPLFPFGHGLGYTTWEYESLRAAGSGPARGRDLELRVLVRNTGIRPGREVVQVYLSGPGDEPGRPLRVLAAFGAVSAGPGEVAEVAIRVPARAFARYDSEAGGWVWPGGTFTLRAGRSSRDLRLTLPVTT